MYCLTNSLNIKRSRQMVRNYRTTLIESKEVLASRSRPLRWLTCRRCKPIALCLRLLRLRAGTRRLRIGSTGFRMTRLTLLLCRRRTITAPITTLRTLTFLLGTRLSRICPLTGAFGSFFGPLSTLGTLTITCRTTFTSLRPTSALMFRTTTTAGLCTITTSRR